MLMKDKFGPLWVVTHVQRVEQQRLPSPGRRNDEVALDPLLAKVLVPEVPVPGLDLVLAVEVLQGGLGDVDPPKDKGTV